MCGSLAESPLTPNAGPFSISSSFSSTNPYVSGPRCSDVATLLAFLGLGDRVGYVSRHLPSREVRLKPDFWTNDDTKHRISVGVITSTITEILLRVCSIFTTGDIDATTGGVALFDYFVGLHAAPCDGDNKQRLLMAVAECYMKAKKASIERRTLRALMASYSRRDVQRLKFSFPFSMAADAFVSARADLASLRNGIPLVKTVKQLQRYEPASVRMAVGIILSPENVNFLSWGTKRVKLKNGSVILPALTRRHSTEAIFESYLAYAGNDGILSRSTFSRIVAALTANGVVLRRAVDYVVGLLVNDPFDNLKTMVLRLNLTSTQILEDMTIVRSYLKYGFDTRVKASQGHRCILHNIKYALSSEDTTSPARIICDDCKAVFYFFARFKTLLSSRGADDVHPSTLKLVDDCSEKARIFLGHRLRTINQQLAIQRLVEEMEEKCLHTKSATEAIVTLDYKMKLEPLYFREKTVDHYGKRGISWHGSLVHYFAYDDRDTSSPTAVDTKLYYDHFSKSDTKQDREAVISVLEAVLMRLRKDVPTIKYITLLSDNATCYQNWFLPLIAPYLSVVHGITIKRIIHTDTQDGKSVLDAHFARAMQHIIQWVKDGNNCITPTQAVIGLQSRGGLQNCASELVQHDREQLGKLTSRVAPMEKMLRKIVSRANEIVISSIHYQPQPTSYASCPDFSLAVYEYSGVGGKTIVCHPSDNTCKCISSVLHGAARQEEEPGAVWDDERLGGEAFVCDDRINSPEGVVVDSETSVDVISRALGIDIGSDMEASDGEDDLVEIMEANSSRGPATGIEIFTQGQLRRRTRNWKVKACSSTPWVLSR